MADALAFDTALVAVIVALSGIALWLVTQFHLLRAVKNIKKDIDSKRKATEGFVVEHLKTLQSSLEGDLGGFEARMRAEIPPNMEGDMAELRAELNDFAKHVGEDMASLPNKIQLAVVRPDGIAQKQLEAMSVEAQNELRAMNAMIPAEMVQTDVRAAILKNLTRPVSPKFSKENPLGALIIDAGRVKLAEWLQTGQTPGGVTYTVTPPRRGGSNMEM